MDSEGETNVPTTVIKTSTVKLETTASITTLPTTTLPADNLKICVLASTLSATFVIIFLIICAIIYYFFIRKKGWNSSPRTRHIVPDLPNKSSDEREKCESAELSFNSGYRPDQDYKVPPKRIEPLPRKIGRKETQTVSRYHGPLKIDENYSIPPTRSESIIEPPPPPDPSRKVKKRDKTESLQQMSDRNESGYYLDMECVKSDFYENVNASADNIYINS